MRGEGVTKREESYVENPDAPADKPTLGAAFSDVAYGTRKADGTPDITGHINSADVRTTDGQLTANENRRFQKLARLAGDRLTFWTTKLTTLDEDETKLRKEASNACLVILTGIEEEMRRRGQFP